MLDEIRRIVCDDRSLDRLLSECRPGLVQIIERAIDGRELTVEEGERLLQAEGTELAALVRAADSVRTRDVGEAVTYVVNRNINWTNVCSIRCRFCAFARNRNDPDAYHRPVAEILERVQDAVDLGATEICLQGGIDPSMERFAYRDLLSTIKDRFPEVHLHAFSPMEILYGAKRTGMSFREYLVMLRDAGLGSMPGTAAEILDDEVRRILCRKKIDVATWIEIVTTAHSVGIPSSATILYGHIETNAHRVRHMVLLRSIQKQTGGFTEFVPLRFIHEQTDLYASGTVSQPPSVGPFDLRMYAVARLMLRGYIDNLQTSWVKLGTEAAQLTLLAGCNDFGGTLMEESITRSAGGRAGEHLPPSQIRELITSIGRIPLERTTTYGKPSPGKARAAGDGPGGRSRSGAVPPRAVSAC